ncbi:DUF7033 domain-containing protein [Pedobacter sandarakinus]|uniref:DUF7033 domain-containing protein n=1 Tax=Pedobacter sandarakinus TaxID=353156 RepID=UPI002247F301|nr:hypothetical protein [Pedobacter sandarakinus]MCX2573973.1 hypothetical protein [Pedobacter sandarakinus]
MQLIVFSSVLTPRIKYIFNFIFRDILKAEVLFTGNEQQFLESTDIKISYGNQPIADELFFKSTPLLFANKVEEIVVKTTIFGENQVPFPVQNSLLPFDVFAASFFILSRYEEYLYQKRTDEEFSANKSYQYKWKILDRPIIDEWALIIRNLIRTRYPQVKFHEKSFVQQLTINIHIEPSAPGGIIEKAKFYANAVLSKDNTYLSNKFDLVTGISVPVEKALQEVEPYVVATNIKTTYFLGFPKVPASYIQLKEISSILKGKSVGLLAPCTSTKQQIGNIKESLSRLKTNLPSLVLFSSQQLEVLKFPVCYLNLISSGVTADYSMGYAATPGFRAGTCTPFSWYDLQLEKVTLLAVTPYAFADTALEHLSQESMNNIIDDLLDAVKMVSGCFCSSWQLKRLSSHLKYKKLNTAFKAMIGSAKN